jgi:hypothetical protein
VDLFKRWKDFATHRVMFGPVRASRRERASCAMLACTVATRHPSKSLAPVARKPAVLDAPKLSPEDRAVLAEAITRADAARTAIDAQWVDLGRWLFTHVFGEDTASAIDHRDDNPIWNALYALADSPKVRVRHDALDRAVLTAAYDKRLNSDGWRALDFGRKWRLLRLADDKLLRKAATHVLSAKLDTRQTDAYVRNLLAEQAEPTAVRASVTALVGQLDRMTERVSAKTYARQLESAAKKLSDEQREALLSSLESARNALDALHARIEKP